jgi:glycerophosphoryl diester phosphodiesterase
MNTIKFERKNALAVAHRGLSGIERENTNAAFVAAGNRSYYGIETDIHRTADGRFVVCHDSTLKRVGGEDVNVEAVSYDVLKNIVLLDKDGTKDREDLRPCTLENYISICKKYEKHCVLELKSDFTEEETARFIEIIRSYDYLDGVTFISFHYDNLVKIRNFLPEQSVQFLFSKFSEDIFERVVADKMDVDVAHGELTEELIARFHNAGIVVNCWTVDNKERAEELASWGVDFITTNILE